ncbi:MAG: asparaginase [Alphaproteobacteria bacterium]|nr:asparaginase [Alphaproteobacteria bacterium]MCB9930060.1 asparaginase [Alphaproteobacteria bacterium]
MPKVAIIGTGGTISSIGNGPLDLLEYSLTGQKMTVDQLVERFPVVRQAADLTLIPYKAVGSPEIGPPHWLELTRMVHAAVAADPELDGVVITHGTATTEETAYFLNLSLKVKQTVVVVGAQRPSSAESTDATLNLYNAIRTAAAPESRGMGVLVLLNDEIQAAREVTKTSTLRLQTFRTADFGVLGHADGDRIAYYRQPLRRRAPETEFEVSGLSGLPRVDISYSYGGVDGTAVRAFLAAGAKGIVAASFAPGMSHPAEVAALEEAVQQGVPVVVSTRAGSGRVAQGRVMDSRGFIAADNLIPQKARILLMLALTRTSDRDEIIRMFAEY